MLIKMNHSLRLLKVSNKQFTSVKEKRTVTLQHGMLLKRTLALSVFDNATTRSLIYMRPITFWRGRVAVEPDQSAQR